MYTVYNGYRLYNAMFRSCRMSSEYKTAAECHHSKITIKWILQRGHRFRSGCTKLSKTILSVDWPTLCYCCWLMWHVSCCCHDDDAELMMVKVNW